MKKILFLLAAILSISFVFAVGIYKNGQKASVLSKKPVRFNLETERMDTPRLRAKIRIAEARSGRVIFEDAIHLTRSGGEYVSNIVFLPPGKYQLDSLSSVEEHPVPFTRDLVLQHVPFDVY